MAEVYILIVDDKPKNLFALERVLASVPATIVKANSGEEALAHTLHYDFALAILDVQMPEMDGYELARFLLDDPVTARTPIIFLSAAYSDEQHSFKGYETGAVDYIVKPFEPAVLLRKVNVFLELAKYRIQLQELVEERSQLLLVEESKFRSIVESSSDCILNLNADGEITFVNAPKNRKYNLKSVFYFLDEHDVELQKIALAHVFSKKECYEFESNMKLPWSSGACSFFHKLNPIIKNNDVIGCVQISRDISQIKIAEQSRANMLRAEAENKAKSKFLASMSHEIRTPMNAILGYAQLLQREPGLTSKQYQYLNVIDSSGEHLMALIDSVLDIAKIEAGRMVVSPTRLNLPDMVRDIARMFNLRANEKGVAINVSVARDVPTCVFVDANKVRQVLINLIGNAVKFTEQGWIKVELDLMGKTSQSPFVNIRVEDSGAGVEKEKLHSIFKAFEQGGVGLRHNGVGLGLAVCKEFADLLGGSISVESQLGIGSVFQFSFPATLANDSEKEDVRKVNSFIFDGQDIPRILVVDDDEGNLNLMGDVLCSVGFKVELARCGKQALEYISKYIPDLVLLDYQMSGMNGNEVTRRIRLMHQDIHIPIIIVTASPFEENKNNALQSGADDFLIKPVREELLFNKIGILLGEKYFHEISNDASITLNKKQYINLEDINCLSSYLTDGLYKALKKGYVNKIDEWLDLIEAENNEVAQSLKEMANSYKYDKLISLLDRRESYNAI